jgi:shikimate kinase
MQALVLVGLSGSGKSTVGRIAAARLGLPFIDTDRRIEQHSGQAIAALFASEGENAFRQRETAVLAEACRQCAVVATGGGAILRAGNRALMREANLVVWLDVPVAALARRLGDHGAGEQRPLLLGGDLRYRLEVQYQERRHLYQAASHVRCTSPNGLALGSRRLAGEVVRIYRRWLDPAGKAGDQIATHGRR